MEEGERLAKVAATKAGLPFEAFTRIVANMRPNCYETGVPGDIGYGCICHNNLELRSNLVAVSFHFLLLADMFSALITNTISFCIPSLFLPTFTFSHILSVHYFTTPSFSITDSHILANPQGPQVH
jgi:hypothetical protein